MEVATPPTEVIPLESRDNLRLRRGYLLKRFVTFVLTGTILLFGAGVLGFRIAMQMLKDRVVAALGPASEIAELKVGWSAVELVDLDIHGPKGWPATRTLRATRVKIVPSLRSLLTDRIEISSITVVNPYLSVLRAPGKLLVLPSLMEAERRHQKQSSAEKRSQRDVIISKLVLQNGTIDVFDATVSQPPLKIRLDQIEAVVRDIAPANLQNKIHFELTGIVNGKMHDGWLKLSGWVGAKGKDSSSHIIMQNVDLVSLQPYVVKRGDARISQGSLDLNLRSDVRSNNLRGIGKMIIRELEFARSQSYLDTFMGIPRLAVISFLKDHDNAINLDFTLEGDIRHPNFSLNETLATRVATGMAGQVGVSIRGVAEGVEALSRKGFESASGAASAIGSAFKGFFGAEGRQ
jgi:hypothetical protein